MDDLKQQVLNLERENAQLKGENQSLKDRTDFFFKQYENVRFHAAVDFYFLYPIGVILLFYFLKKNFSDSLL